jgi:hypothetical protein
LFLNAELSAERSDENVGSDSNGKHNPSGHEEQEMTLQHKRRDGSNTMTTWQHIQPKRRKHYEN